LSRNSPCFGTRGFISMFTGAHRWFLFWARRIQSTSPLHHFLRSILLLSSYLRLYFPLGLSPSGFATYVLYAFLISTMRAICPAHLIFPDLIVPIIIEACTLWSSSFCSLLQPPATYFSYIQMLSSAPCPQTPLKKKIVSFDKLGLN
jgi:hypothetical protein